MTIDPLKRVEVLDYNDEKVAGQMRHHRCRNVGQSKEVRPRDYRASSWIGGISLMEQLHCRSRAATSAEERNDPPRIVPREASVLLV
jgi:hypothetical protein